MDETSEMSEMSETKPTQPMSPFNHACRVILPLERGYQKDDNGRGAVRWGITQYFLDLIGDQRDPAKLSWNDAKALYKEHFWDKWRLGEITSLLITDYMFGMLINTDPQQIVRRAQMAVAVGQHTNLKIDGRIGPKTLAALNAIDPRHFRWSFYNFIQNWYDIISAGNSQNRKQLHGWMNRNKWLYTYAGADVAAIPSEFSPALLVNVRPVPPVQI